MVIPHLTRWLQFGGITLAIGWLSIAVHAHVASGALVAVGLSPNRSTLRTLAKAAAVAAVILGLLAIPQLARLARYQRGPPTRMRPAR